MKDLTIVFENNNEAVTSSRLVAEYFGKRHDTVTRAIRNLNCSKEFRQRNFAESYYYNLQNKKQTEYLMTKNGFTILAMGFTGAKAMQFKEAYINAFDKMQELLKRNETILQLEKRIEVLEQANKPFNKMSNESILDDYFKALKKAIESEKYCIINKKDKGNHKGEILGIYDETTISLKARKSYEIYSKYCKKPVNISLLHSLIATKGLIIQGNRTHERYVNRKTIDNKIYYCLVFKRHLLEDYQQRGDI